jgi:hypothetical protein
MENIETLMIYYKFMCLHLQSWCTSSINDLSFGLMTKFKAWERMWAKKVSWDLNTPKMWENES